jgi:hypothetical protein
LYADRFGFQQPGSVLFGANRGHEDSGNTMATGNQAVLKIGPVHAGHLPIADEARCLHDEIRAQIVFGGGESGDIVAHRNNKGFQSVAKTLIIVDNANQKLL